MRTAQLRALPAEGPLPERVVLVRSEAVAHCWRREVAVEEPALLLGTRFITPLAAAVAVLEDAGVPVVLGEEAVRPARLAALFARARLDFVAFDRAVLTEQAGWAQAIASTIGELERADVTPEALRACNDPRCVDLAKLWDALDVQAGASSTAARVLTHAAKLLEDSASAWPFGGPALMEVTGHESAAIARFVRTIPKVQFAPITLRPARSALLERRRALFRIPVDAASSAPPLSTPASERALLAQLLFEAPEVLAASDRPRAARTHDGTVAIEEHAGLDEELDAAVAWVIGEVAEHGTPLEQLAIVVPQLDPHAGLLVDRLHALAPTEEEPRVHVVGGVPASGTLAGARTLTVLRALAEYLHVDGLAEVVPLLRLDEERSLSRRDALDALYELGTPGGSRANRRGALDWSERRPARLESLTRALAQARKDEDGERALRALERSIEHLRAIGPALDALVSVARTVVDDAPLESLWAALRAFLGAHVRVGVDGAKLLGILDEALAPLIAANVLSGEAALDAIADAVRSLRFTLGRFGEPRVTVVSLADAVGLSFRAVRVLGLAEGVVPPNVRDDPVLPDAVREALGPSVPRASDRALAHVHALLLTLQGATERVALSVSRMDFEGRYREPSGVLIEALAALGRVDEPVPDLSALRREAFIPARTRLTQLRERWPITTRDQLTRAAASRVVPASWRSEAPRELDALLAKPGGPGPLDGFFSSEGPFVPLPGLDPARPTSASALATLLTCPHRFLFERVLGWRAPPSLLDEGTIDALSYGSLFHETAEAFYREHGAAFCARPRPITEWIPKAERVADARFEAFLEGYPLVGDAVRAAQRTRLHRDVRALLELDAKTPKRFVAVEQAFGPQPIVIDGKTVHLQGWIDRLDVLSDSGTTLLRDLKTGRAKPRAGKKAAWMHAYDVQLGVYGLVVRENARAWDVPSRVTGAFVYPSDLSRDERSFHADFPELLAHTEAWVGAAIGLLEKRTFPRTPATDDCTFCPFQPVCGPKAQERAATLLQRADGPLGAFASLKLQSEEDDD